MQKKCPKIRKKGCAATKIRHFRAGRGPPKMKNGACLGRPSSPGLKWSITHAASILNRYCVNSDGVTPYEALHGQKPTLKVVEFGEQVFYSVPKRLRSKLTKRWRIGTYLGLSSASNEHLVATHVGNVIKARTVCRVVEASRWSADAVQAIKGTPSKMCPVSDEDISP